MRPLVANSTKCDKCFCKCNQVCVCACVCTYLLRLCCISSVVLPFPFHTSSLAFIPAFQSIRLWFPTSKPQAVNHQWVYAAAKKHWRVRWGGLILPSMRSQDPRLMTWLRVPQLWGLGKWCRFSGGSSHSRLLHASGRVCSHLSRFLRIRS